MIKKRLTVLGRKAHTMGHALVMTASGAVLAVALTGNITREWAALAIIVFLVALLVASVAKRRNRETRTQDVTFARDGIQLEGEALLPASVIKNGYFVPSRQGSGHLRICGDGGSNLVELSVDDEAEADALLAALGLDPMARAHFDAAPPRILRTRDRSIAGAVGVLVAVGAALVPGTWPLAGALALLAVWLFAMAVAPAASVEIGVDGVSIRWIGFLRFIRFEEIADVAIAEGDAELRLRSGERIRVAFRADEAGVEAGARNALVLRLKAMMARRSSAARIASVLARGHRSVADWATALASASEGSGYRDAGLGVDDLAAALRDPTSASDVRFAAAWLLARNDAGGKARVRVEAEAIAEPRLRVAIEDATEVDDFEEAWTTKFNEAGRGS